MTETATILKYLLSSNNTNQTDNEELRANVTFYSQILWDDLYEFVQYVTCSQHPTESKIEWIEYSERLINVVYNNTRSSDALDYYDVMLTLTETAKDEPTCQPEFYAEYFGMADTGTVDIEMLVLR